MKTYLVTHHFYSFLGEDYTQYIVSSKLDLERYYDRLSKMDDNLFKILTSCNIEFERERGDSISIKEKQPIIIT